MIDEQIAISASLWLEPLDSKSMKMIKLIILSTPVLVSIVTIWIMYISKDFISGFATSIILDPFVYTGMNISTFILMILGYMVIKRRMNNYKKDFVK